MDENNGNTKEIRSLDTRCTYPISDRYLIPDAIPRSIPTNWIIVNFPSLLYKTSRKPVSVENYEVKNVIQSVNL